MDDCALQRWVGRSETVGDEVSLGITRCLAALLDREPGEINSGVLASLVVESSLGADGHPHGGELLPPSHLPRCMFNDRIKLARNRMWGRLAAFTTCSYRPLLAGRSASLACHVQPMNCLRLWALDDKDRVAVGATAEGPA